MQEVEMAMDAVLEKTNQVVVMQCNTNYTASITESREDTLERFKNINLRVLETYSNRWPGIPVGLSDHTHGDVTVLGAVALGARIVEKHFTDDVTQDGPDHHFSMTPETWRSMVDRTRQMEAAMGHHEKVVADNERETVVIQRRGLRFAAELPVGTELAPEHLVALRPATPGSVTPDYLDEVLGKTLTQSVELHDVVTREVFV